MKILFLCPYESDVKAYLETFGDEVSQTSDPIEPEFVLDQQIDFLVSYGYRHIIGAKVLEDLQSRAVNLHISFLPWNRGSQPNVWSFIDDTPKGISIHYIDAGIDTGDIIAQRKIVFSDAETLATSHQRLRKEVEHLFHETWPSIRDGSATRQKQRGAGSFHSAKELEQVVHLLTEGWDTPVAELTGVRVSKSRGRS